MLQHSVVLPREGTSVRAQSIMMQGMWLERQKALRKRGFQSNFVQIVNFNDTWMRLPVFVISSKSYELRQMFAMRFELIKQEVIA